ncbi:MAG TPA: PrsW family intramembrane metalloprotease, partial [Bacteroidetes bacterium]|nr:PrsW family intramembrane metalloprotease [Bacteroidota bacterium]
MLYLLEILALGLAPVIFIFTIVYVQDKHDREPLGMLIITFVLGIAIAIPAVFLEVNLSKILTLSNNPNFAGSLIKAMVVVAASEEGLKFLVLRGFAYRSRHFDEPYDGIMYAVAVSMGFAAIENVLYISEYDFETGIFRAFTAVPGHAMMAIVMGYFVGLAKFGSTPGTRARNLLTGLGAAILIHGLY